MWVYAFRMQNVWQIFMVTCGMISLSQENKRNNNNNDNTLT